MTSTSRPLGFIGRAFSWLASRWSREWRWYFQRSLSEHRHYRRLIPLLALLTLLTVIWSLLVLALGLLIGGTALIWHRAFVQNVVASLLVLPIGLAIGVFVGTLIQKHSLRFQVRHAGDKLGDCVRLEVFKLILFLRKDCGLPIDIEGPTDHRMVWRARETAIRSFTAPSWSGSLPADFPVRIDDTVDSISSCFRRSIDLRLAFPRSFDLMERLEALIASIRSGQSQSGPTNTALIVLNFAAQMIEDLE
jgi:hypothetical protein